MECKIIQNKKDLIELEFDDKTLPNAILPILQGMGIDAYVSEPHPLLMGYRLHVEGKGAMKNLSAAVRQLENDWKKFGKMLERVPAR